MAVVFLAPLLDEILSLRDRVEEIAIQAFPLERTDEAFDEGVFPAMTGFDVEGMATAGIEPGFDFVGNELRAIVAAEMLRHAARSKQPLQHIQHPTSRGRSGR